MLSYDDSKRLKELGYEQELKEGDWFWLVPDRPPQLYRPCAESLFFGEGGYQVGAEYVYVKVPTTDGMIKGLKKAYSCFHTLSINIFDGGVSVDFVLTDPVTQFLSAKITGFGDFIEQALCSVWKKRKE